MPLQRWSRLLGLVLLASTARAETVTIFAAASLSEPFRAIAKDFEAAHNGTTVELQFAGSSTLARQILDGAPADVFASADDANMQKVAEAVAGTPQVFARNRLAILVGAGNPKHVVRLADLTRAGMTIALAAPSVPVGGYALEAFAKAGVAAPAGSNEADGKAVVTRVAMGEVDAGVVYVTDVAAGGSRVEGVAIPDDQNVIARYPIAALKDAPNAAGARAFVACVLSQDGRQALTASGFLLP